MILHSILFVLQIQDRIRLVNSERAATLIARAYHESLVDQKIIDSWHFPPEDTTYKADYFQGIYFVVLGYKTAFRGDTYTHVPNMGYAIDAYIGKMLMGTRGSIDAMRKEAIEI